MIKPNALRAALCAAIPVLDANPDMLRMWVDKGRIMARAAAANRAFEYRYTLNLVIENWSGEECVVFLALNEWLSAQQPDLLTQSGEGGYAFEADIIDADSVDLSIELPLTEAVRVAPRANGGFELTFIDEQVPLFAEYAEATDPPAPLNEVWWLGERLIPETAP